jgi:F0F1-type ATP synthase assembly protein I
MELDDLKTTWGEMNQRLEASLAMSRAAIREVKLDKTRSALRWLSAELGYELISGIAVALLIGWFLTRNFDALRFAIPALGLLAFVVGTIAASIRQLATIGNLDYAGPVIAIQRPLADLHTFRVRMTRWILIVAPLLWTPLVIVVSRCLGFDIYRGFGPTWLAWNFAFGVAFIAVALWVSHRYGPRFARTRIGRVITDSLAGRSLAAAQSRLDEIGRFEREEEN